MTKNTNHGGYKLTHITTWSEKLAVEIMTNTNYKHKLHHGGATNWQIWSEKLSIEIMKYMKYRYIDLIWIFIYRTTSKLHQGDSKLTPISIRSEKLSIEIMKYRIQKKIMTNHKTPSRSQQIDTYRFDLNS